MISSILDDDLYKFTMQQAILKLYPNAIAEYRFKNRGEHKFNLEFLCLLNKNLEQLYELKATDFELEYLSKINFFNPWYIEYLRNFRYLRNTIKTSINGDDLCISIIGPWRKTVLWEVKLMALISETYFSLNNNWTIKGQEEILKGKKKFLNNAGAKFADFGTRRRRSYDVQDLVVNVLSEGCGQGFVGTSNVHFAQKYNVKPIGTMAHEWIQGISVLESLNHANRYMMSKWYEVYHGCLGIALTDTFGTQAFLEDFDMFYAKIFDGVRQDSGDPFQFAYNIHSHYKKLGIDPQSKTIVFSDSLDVFRAVRLQNFCDNIGIKCSFGIGTNFTNDFSDSALNMVMKLWSINDIPVVKLSDDKGKHNGDSDMINIVKSIYGC